MEKKYTMQEFRRMFTEAEAKALMDMDEQLKQAEKETNSSDNMFGMMLSMHAMMFGAMISKNLFKD